MSRLALATKSAGFEQRVRRAFRGDLNGELQRWREAVDGGDLRALIGDLDPAVTDVVALGPDVAFDAALQLAQTLEEHRPEVTVLLFTDPSPEVFERALHAGVRDVVAANASDEELRVVLQRAMETADRRRRNLAVADGGTRAAGRVITVVAPKGGSGKTAIATNLGVGLAQAAPGRVVLVDLDVQFGDITAALELTPEHTFEDVIGDHSKLDVTALKVLLTKRDDGLFVLCAPDTPDKGEQIGEAAVHRVIDLLSHEFDYVVVDTSAGLNELTLSALELSSDLILLCDMSVGGIHGMQKLVTALEQLDMLTAERHFVLNRADSRVGIELTDVAASVGMAVDIRLPSSRSVVQSMNEGTPLVELSPYAAYSRRIGELVARFAPVPAPRRVFPFWRR